MICLIALIIFGILAIFSVRYRVLAKEAFDCVFRRLIFKPCKSNLNERIKVRVTGRLMLKHPGVARGLYHNFELVSWVFTILMIVSLVYSGIGIYNYIKYGNCNGPHNNDFCIFNPLGNDVSCGSEHCAEEGCSCGEKETNCTAENNYTACKGNCTCNREVCG